MHVCLLYVVIFIYVFCTINIKFSLKKKQEKKKKMNGGLNLTCDNRKRVTQIVNWDISPTIFTTRYSPHV